MTEPEPNKHEQEILNKLFRLLQIHSMTQLGFGLIETELRALSRNPVKNPLAPTILQELVKARFAMGGYGGPVGTA